jgi:hypothetical protein
LTTELPIWSIGIPYRNSRKRYEPRQLTTYNPLQVV